MSSVTRADLDHEASGLTKYYAESGTPPGRFLGAGLAGLADDLGVEPGAIVSEEALFRMLGMLQDPVTGKQLGRTPSTAAVAGFDLTFSVPKSVSVAWALADGDTRQAIEAAHHRALQEVIAYGEAQVFASRTGRNGIVRESIRGVVATGFDHWDSRAGDPQLHTHVVVLNRAQTADGQWRTLDSKALFKAAVGMSELYNALLADRLTDALGWAWEPVARTHSHHVSWEVAGVPVELQRDFSQRSQAIRVSKDDLIDRFTRTHRRPPTSDEVIKLRQQATLDTREAKQHHSLHDLTAGWNKRAAKLVDNPATITRSLSHRSALPVQTKDDLDPTQLVNIARVALAEVADKRATLSRANVLAEVHRQMQGIRFATANERITTADTITADALAQALPIGTMPFEPAFADRILTQRRRFSMPKRASSTPAETPPDPPPSPI